VDGRLFLLKRTQRTQLVSVIPIDLDCPRPGSGTHFSSPYGRPRGVRSCGRAELEPIPRVRLWLT
jgi:hypothetical protein